MKKELIFNQTISKEKNTIHIVREFAADIQSVWNAWTKPEILSKWWAPKPYHVETKTFDFREGGIWLYAMVGPENDKYWSRVDYKSIKLQQQILCQDAFSDEKGNVDPEKPSSLWINNFSEHNGITTLNITLQFERLTDLEMLIKMGFKEGISMTFNSLEKLLKKEDIV